MVDGTIARKTKSVSELGARLDTLADNVFSRKQYNFCIVLYSNKVKRRNVKSVLQDYAKKHSLVGFIAKYYVA